MYPAVIDKARTEQLSKDEWVQILKSLYGTLKNMQPSEC